MYAASMLIYTQMPKNRKRTKKVAKTRKARKVFKEKSKPVEQRYRAPGSEHLPSKIDSYLATTDPKNPMPQRYEGDLAAREAAAQEEILRKSKCVAPAFNKGPYQYIATEEQAKWVGKK